MAVKKVYELTQAGVDKLKEELIELKDVKRKENLEALKEAREQGDLSENADYDAARNEQARIESRILEIDTILKNLKIIKTSDDASVNIGKVVKLKFVEKNQIKEFHLVGTIETDPITGKISIESPLGKSIKGHEKGETVLVKSETGRNFHVEILEVA
ncbi:Transcription elongation factor GreA [Alteracholeplasma palmae J233]|uniref:Transcription elongation factor GreA n=1 Tax=Alteracholeplasma palmae (strain ATCC 49389 / J233) TaxID=1318466 RepID=U4KPR5_ALTPJ|nr:transcription elongation factor GreA [Alteracholeplasma palmae]CCV64275.1 Transcription elongation factor GreA [Alteracholeplasma palmae J233]